MTVQSSQGTVVGNCGLCNEPITLADIEDGRASMEDDGPWHVDCLSEYLAE